jgi:hypothetical protein
VRYIGRFLPDDPLEVPWVVIEHIAEQLGIEDASSIKRYTERPKTAYEHAWEIRDAYRTFLHGRAWTAHAEGPKALFDHAVGWLRRNRVLLPGGLVGLLEVPERKRFSQLEELRRLPTRTTGTALQRVDEIAVYRLGRLRLDKLPPNRL